MAGFSRTKRLPVIFSEGLPVPKKRFDKVKTTFVRNNSHGLTWSINTQTQPTTKHGINSISYFEFHIKCFLTITLGIWDDRPYPE